MNNPAAEHRPPAPLMRPGHPEPKLTKPRNPQVREASHGQARQQAPRPQEEERQPRQAPQRLNRTPRCPGKRRCLPGHRTTEPPPGPSALQTVQRPVEIGAGTPAFDAAVVVRTPHAPVVVIDGLHQTQSMKSQDELRPEPFIFRRPPSYVTQRSLSSAVASRSPETFGSPPDSTPLVADHSSLIDDDIRRNSRRIGGPSPKPVARHTSTHNNSGHGNGYTRLHRVQVGSVAGRGRPLLAEGHRPRASLQRPLLHGLRIPVRGTRHHLLPPTRRPPRPPSGCVTGRLRRHRALEPGCFRRVLDHLGGAVGCGLGRARERGGRMRPRVPPEP